MSHTYPNPKQARPTLAKHKIEHILWPSRLYNYLRVSLGQLSLKIHHHRFIWGNLNPINCLASTQVCVAMPMCTFSFLHATFFSPLYKFISSVIWSSGVLPMCWRFVDYRYIFLRQLLVVFSVVTYEVLSTALDMSISCRTYFLS